MVIVTAVPIVMGVPEGEIDKLVTSSPEGVVETVPNAVPAVINIRESRRETISISAGNLVLNIFRLFLFFLFIIFVPPFVFCGVRRL
jgi:hypothetical protein